MDNEKELTLSDRRYQRMKNATPEEKEILNNWEPNTDDLKILWDIIKNHSFGIDLNANDFFGYACGDGVRLDDSDIHWVLPIVKKYGRSGVDAVMSYIADTLPITPHITENFTKALEEIKAIDPIVFSEY